MAIVWGPSFFHSFFLFSIFSDVNLSNVLACWILLIMNLHILLRFSFCSCLDVCLCALCMCLYVYYFRFHFLLYLNWLNFCFVCTFMCNSHYFFFGATEFCLNVQKFYISDNFICGYVFTSAIFRLYLFNFVEFYHRICNDRATFFFCFQFSFVCVFTFVFCCCCSFLLFNRILFCLTIEVFPTSSSSFLYTSTCI